MPPAPPFPILISNAQIRRRTHELARQIAAAHQDAPPVLVAVMEGARTFALLLARSLPCGLPVHAISASSYGSGTQSSGVVKVVETGD
ncbi:MAG TPA: hypoxanthine phosphoribosyltransferase, partial [Planctomycetota bacterium]|nr:hypoxanthine phosphoribosyltransferase [Planctomycetota bacterium]